MQRNEIQKGLMGRMLGKTVKISLLYMGILAAVLALGYAMGHSVIWYGTEPSYPLFHWISVHAWEVGIFLLVVGELLILLACLWKICGYFQEILERMSQIYEMEPQGKKQNQDWIVLPEELKEAERRMNLLHQKVQESRRRAKEAEQRKNDLVVYLAHDLKTPLTSVLGYLLLLEEAGELPLEMRQKYIGIARRKAQRLEDLINEFFEITRFNLTAMEMEWRSINFTRLLEQTIFEFQPMLAQKQMTCDLDAEPDLMLTCDLDKIQRVVDNLLRNGILYGYEKSQLTVSLREVGQASQGTGISEKETLGKGDSGETFPEGGPWVELSCTNQGPTIPEGKLERIFEQFYRLDSARTSSTGGAGLGLAIAKEIVQLHGGSITAESRNEVTVFRVLLPGSFGNASVICHE